MGAQIKIEWKDVGEEVSKVIPGGGLGILSENMSETFIQPFSPMSFTGIRFCAFCASCELSGGICGFCKVAVLMVFWDCLRMIGLFYS